MGFPSPFPHPLRKITREEGEEGRESRRPREFYRGGFSVGVLGRRMRTAAGRNAPAVSAIHCASSLKAGGASDGARVSRDMAGKLTPLRGWIERRIVGHRAANHVPAPRVACWCAFESAAGRGKVARPFPLPSNASPLPLLLAAYSEMTLVRHFEAFVFPLVIHLRRSLFADLAAFSADGLSALCGVGQGADSGSSQREEQVLPVPEMENPKAPPGYSWGPRVPFTNRYRMCVTMRSSRAHGTEDPCSVIRDSAGFVVLLLPRSSTRACYETGCLRVLSLPPPPGPRPQHIPWKSLEAQA